MSPGSPLADGIVSAVVLAMVATCAGVEAVLVSDWAWRIPYGVAAVACAFVAGMVWHGTWRLMPSESSES